MSGRLQRVEELGEPVEVGRRYLVPGIRADWCGRTDWWPVIGPRHEDAAIIDFPWLHYHLDARFFTPRQWVWLLNPAWDPERQIAGLPICQKYGAPPPARPTWRRRECRALKTGFAVLWHEYRPPYWLDNLFAAYATASARRPGGRLVCPHKGAPLGNCPVDPDGTVTCPLHGLRWHAETGRIAL